MEFMKKTRKSAVILVSVLVLVWIGVFLRQSVQRSKWIKVPLSDGRILQIEGLSYGKDHQVGRRSPILDKWGFWLPHQAQVFLRPAYSHCEFSRESDELVVWVNAVEGRNGKHVDAQGAEATILDPNGDVYPTSTRYCFLGDVCRVAHVFPVYPRDQRELKLKFTLWRGGSSEIISIPNPHVIHPSFLSGGSLPQFERFGDVALVFTGLTVETNGYSTNYSGRPPLWEPKFEIRRSGERVSDWLAPEWVAEDHLGNRGHFMGLKKPALKFEVMVYPSATNMARAKVVASLEPIKIRNLTQKILWNRKGSFGTNQIVIQGLFPPGTHVFSEGLCVSNQFGMGPVIGGAPSGWTGTSQRISPSLVQYWDAHYTPDPTIYIQCDFLGETNNLEVRLRDKAGRYWVATQEPECRRQNVRPFILNLPEDVDEVVPEVVMVSALRAEFVVKIPVINSELK